MRFVIKADEIAFEMFKSFGIKNYSKLTRKVITDKNGHRKTVWVRNEINTKHLSSTGKNISEYNKKELIEFFINKIENEEREESFEECKKIIDELGMSKFKNIQQFLRLVNSSEFDDYLYTYKVLKKADSIDLRVNYVNKDLNVISGKIRGDIKSFAEADKTNSNPYFGILPGYSDNCASCVAVFEARLRGFNVKTKPRKKEKGNTVDFIAKNDVDIWKIQGKDKYPSFTQCNEQNNLLYDKFNAIIQTNERYEFKYETDRRKIGNVEYINNHVLVIGKDNNNTMFIYDPQSAELNVGKDECNDYLSFYGCLEYMRIDNLDFNVDKINGVME